MSDLEGYDPENPVIVAMRLATANWGDKSALALRLGVSEPFVSRMLKGYAIPPDWVARHFGFERRRLVTWKDGRAHVRYEWDPIAKASP